MDEHQPYRKPDLLEKLKKFTLGYDIKELKSSLSKLVEKALEKAGISEIGRFDVSMGLHYPRDDNESISKPKRHGYNYLTYITEDFYSKGKCDYLAIYAYDKDNKKNILSCHLDPIPNKIICANYTNYNGKTFTLPDPLQKFTFPEDIKKSILNILDDILDQGELTNMGNKYMNIVTETSMYPGKSIEANPVISIYRSEYNNEFIYDDNGSKVKITWWYLHPSSKS
jgi:hypothetical protein